MHIHPIVCLSVFQNVYVSANWNHPMCFASDDFQVGLTVVAYVLLSSAWNLLHNMFGRYCAEFPETHWRNIHGCSVLMKHCHEVIFTWNKYNQRALYREYLQHHDDVIKWKHFPRYWPFVRGIHRSPVNIPHKGQWGGALMFSLICVWIKSWVSNREAGDLRH